MACRLCGLLGRYLERNGRQFDVAVDTLLGGPEDQTVSVSCARAQLRGAWWGRVMCAVLSALVQKDHCTKALTDQSIGALVYIRAGLAFGFAAVAGGAIVHAVLELL